MTGRVELTVVIDVAVDLDDPDLVGASMAKLRAHVRLIAQARCEAIFAKIEGKDGIGDIEIRQPTRGMVRIQV